MVPPACATVATASVAATSAVIATMLFPIMSASLRVRRLRSVPHVRDELELPVHFGDRADPHGGLGALVVLQREYELLVRRVVGGLGRSLPELLPGHGRVVPAEGREEARLGVDALPVEDAPEVLGFLLVVLRAMLAGLDAPRENHGDVLV